MAQGVGSLLGGPVAALIHDAVGSWVPVFGIAIGLDLVVAALGRESSRGLRYAPPAGTARGWARPAPQPTAGRTASGAAISGTAGPGTPR
jgi:OFA family oxalate/formate antiporter-like MFS transporter